MKIRALRDGDVTARAVRGSASRARALRSLCAGVLLLFVLTILPNRAFASHSFDNTTTQEWTGVWYHSYVGDGQQLIAGSYNKFDAAALMCGYSKSAINDWDIAVRYKLSTRDTAFLSLVNDIGNVTPWNDETLYSSLGEYFGSPLWDSMQYLSITGGLNVDGLTIWQVQSWQQNMPSGMSVFALSTTSYNLGAAREAIETVLNDSDSGGGSGGNVVDGRTITFNMQVQSTVYKTNQTPRTFSISGTTYTFGTPVPTGATLVDNFVMNVTMREDLLDGYDYVCYVANNNSNALGYNVYVLKRGHYTISDATYDGTRYTQTYKVITTDEPYYGGVVATIIDIGDKSVVNGTIVCNATYPNELTTSRPAGTIYVPIDYNNYSTNIPYAFSSQIGGDEPTGPGDWPDDPVPTPPRDPTVPEPTTPELPTPTTPVVPPDVPSEPTTNIQDPTDATDYTPWLAAILAQLRSINTALTNHCTHIQQQIVNQSTNLLNKLDYSVERLIDWSDELLRALTRYLEQLFEWLADELDFTFGGDSFDDSSIVSWLKRIYNKMGGYTAPRITDPTGDEPFNWWTWLLQQIANGLGGAITGLVAGITGLIDSINSRFPFSLPWDIAAILGLLSSPGMTPVFDVTIPAVQGWWSAITFHIDLTPFNGAAAVAKTMLGIWWMMVLAMKTNDMLAMMYYAADLSGGFIKNVTGSTD